MYKSVLKNIPTKAAAIIFDVVISNYNERLLANIPSFMSLLHEIKLPLSESLSPPIKDEKCLLSLIK